MLLLLLLYVKHVHALLQQHAPEPRMQKGVLLQPTSRLTRITQQIDQISHLGSLPGKNRTAVRATLYKSTEFKILEPARVARNANFRPLPIHLDQDFRPRSGSKTQDFSAAQRRSRDFSAPKTARIKMLPI